MELYTRAHFEEAANSIRARIQHQPRIGIVLGSGLGEFAGSVKEADIIRYDDIPHWPGSSVEGHSGQLHVGRLEGQTVIVMSGRSHFYEGQSMSQITLPIRVMQLIGIQLVILTNAAGALDPSFAPGELMAITDHLNLPGMVGHNPLRGPNDNSLGPRFPGMVQVYDPEVRRIALEIAEENNIPLRQGVYAFLAGPSFETPAEIRFLRTVGAHAVGMSTVPEAIVARHGGMRVAGFSGITNVTIDETTSTAETTHEEVLETGKVLVPRLVTLLRGVLQRLEL